MIMPRGTPILLPASPFFMGFTLLFFWLLQILLFATGFYFYNLIPNFFVLVMLFWSIREPQRMSLGLAFIFGLFTDIQTISLLGENALYFTIIAFLGLILHRRLLLFNAFWQAIHIVPLLVLTQLLLNGLHMLLFKEWGGWGFVFSSLLSGVVWPFLSAILLWPQKRSHNPDDERPL